MAKKRKGRKVRVSFRQNRQARRRDSDWTRRYHADEHNLADAQSHESVRAKGDLSRKRTVLVDDDDVPIVDQSMWIEGRVTRVHGLICYADDAENREWACTVRRVLRTLSIDQRSPAVVGDVVWFSDHSQSHDGERVGVIERVADRRSTLSRRERRGREHTIVANADQLLIVASVAEPNLKPHLIDRYIVAGLKGNLTPIVCFNKVDLRAETLDYEEFAEREERPADGTSAESELDAVFDEFQGLGYPCLRTSARDGVGLSALQEALRGHITVLSGQSGVGKSSLLNAMQPSLDLAVQEVSRENEKGRHTTTFSRLLRLEVGGYVVDTPGIRMFDLWNIEAGELEAYFVEFEPYIPRCRFGDCSHRYETGCAVIAAVEAGDISERRYFSYLKMFEEV